jgi:HAD superfamily hydrolase (TIGR01662 family)
MLFIFDLDGTLVESFGTQPLPGVSAHLERINNSGHNMAVATNQAGLTWRIWTRAPKFPDVQSMVQRLTQITQNLPMLQHVPWFMSLFDDRVSLSPEQYHHLVLNLETACPTLILQVRAIPEWRKPLPGMLLAAGQYFNLNLDALVFVGDHQTDAEAAEAAGIQFIWAEKFFSTSLA